MTPLACMHIPSFSPEILTTRAGPYFIVQFLNGSHLLSALHSYSDTLSVRKVFDSVGIDICTTYKNLNIFTGS